MSLQFQSFQLTPPSTSLHLRHPPSISSSIHPRTFQNTMFKCTKSHKSNFNLPTIPRKTIFNLNQKKWFKTFRRQLFEASIKAFHASRFHFQTCFIEPDKIIDKFQSTKTFVPQSSDRTSPLFWKIIFLCCHIFTVYWWINVSIFGKSFLLG
jgi:hypothetical protein